MKISSLSFICSFAMGVPLLFVLALVAWLTRRRARWRCFSRGAISIVAALTFTPTVWAPFGKIYMEAAALVVFSGVVGFTSPLPSILIGGLPIAGVAGLVMLGWPSGKDLNRKSEE
jgi:hypothetical protein